jgi:hypothetical protein
VADALLGDLAAFGFASLPDWGPARASGYMHCGRCGTQSCGCIHCGSVQFTLCCPSCLLICGHVFCP